MNQKLTPWFPADVKPVHVGWYDADIYAEEAMPWYWDGEQWRDAQDGWVCYKQNREWRGLAEKPE